MAEQPDHEGVMLGQVVITRMMTGDDIIDHVIASSPEGDEMGLAEALGMMRLAEDTLIRARMDDSDDD